MDESDAFIVADGQLVHGNHILVVAPIQSIKQAKYAQTYEKDALIDFLSS